jgi:hypothetical protein
MEVVLDWEDVILLLRESLATHGIFVPDEAIATVRTNHKKNTLRVAFRGFIEQTTVSAEDPPPEKS